MRAKPGLDYVGAMTNAAGNLHEYTVSELSGAVKRTIEDSFALVRVKGELGRVTRAASGHMYLDLKDEKATLSSVVWKGVASRLSIAPEQGMEVVATGRMTTFPGQSRYQLVIESLEPAGAGALMALFEKRKAALAAEGLFADERKRPLPYLPEVIGVVTSPSGAVIRDILHRLRDRFPRHVIVWPTLVQGRGAEEKIAAAIRGFNALPHGGDIPRPDVLIVARGGGSLEDLWCFNEEAVARAAAASEIPLISAVGHETDTTLIDYVADRRAPTPTAAAEMAVPVRAELLSETLNKARRMIAAHARLMEGARSGLTSAERGLGRPEDLIGAAGQRLDRQSDRLAAALSKRAGLAATALAQRGRLGPLSLANGLGRKEGALDAAASRLTRNSAQFGKIQHQRLASLRVSSGRIANRLEMERRAFAQVSGRIAGIAVRLTGPLADRLASAGKLLTSLSYQGVLERGFALVRGPNGAVARRAGALPEAGEVVLTFHDGERVASLSAPSGDRQTALAKPKKSESRPGGKQATLFD